VHLHALNEDDLIAWREGSPADLKVTTKQRFVNDLKAALNAAWPRLSSDRKNLTDVPCHHEGRLQSRSGSMMMMTPRLLGITKFSRMRELPPSFKLRVKSIRSKDSRGIYIGSSYVWPRPARGMPRSGECAWATPRFPRGV